jgi:hypothetical protein
MAASEDYPYFNHNHPHAATRSRQFNYLVKNIVETHDNLEKDYPHVLRAGKAWYDRAHEIAHEVGKGDVHKGAGIIAALSPQKGWEQNVDMAKQMVSKGPKDLAQYPVQIKKATRIHEGEHPKDVLGGMKETSFYHNIADPNDPHHVTIDRHAHDVAVGKKYGSAERGLGTAGRYSTFHGAYNAASEKLGIETPSRLQAGVWVGQEQGLTRMSRKP